MLFSEIFVVAFSTLLIELALIRILSFTIWYHFSYVVISTALLGFGAAGTFLALRPRLGTYDCRSTLARCAGFAGAATLGALGFIAAAPLHPTAILEDPLQLGLFVAYQVVVAVPFFFGGLLVSLILRIGAKRVDRVYFWDLAGAGFGCAAAVLLMNLLTPPGAAIAAAAGFFGGCGHLLAGTPSAGGEPLPGWRPARGIALGRGDSIHACPRQGILVAGRVA